MPLFSQSPYFKDSDDWLRKAEACKPALIYTDCMPVTVVKSVKDDATFQGWRMEDVGETDVLFSESLKKHSGIIFFSIKSSKTLGPYFPYILSPTIKSPLEYR